MGESAGCTKTLSFELALTRVRDRGVRWLHENPEKWKWAISLVGTVGIDFSSRLPRSRGWVDWYPLDTSEHTEHVCLGFAPRLARNREKAKKKVSGVLALWVG